MDRDVGRGRRDGGATVGAYQVGISVIARGRETWTR